MACNCPGAPNGYANAVYPSGPIPQYRQVDECAGAYMSRAEDSQVPAPEVLENKIANIQLTFACDWTIKDQLRMTGPEQADKWVMEPGTDWFYNNDGTVDETRMNAFTNTGKIDGWINPSKTAKVFNITIKAYKGNTLLDSKPFTVVAEACTEGDYITFINPLPGGFINSLCNDSRCLPGSNPRPHCGVDIKRNDTRSATIVAAADGRIVSARCGSGGNTITIEHRNKKGKHLCNTVYMHLSKFLLTSGDVKQGTPIGIEGGTGEGGVKKYGEHLHFEIRGPGGEVWDPALYIPASIDTETNPGRVTGQTQPGKWADQNKPFFLKGPPGTAAKGVDPSQSYKGGGTASTAKAPATVTAQPVQKPAAPPVNAVTPAKADNPCGKAKPNTPTQSAPNASAPDPGLPADGECWQIAFNFTMKSEVSQSFNPSDPDTIAGCVGCSDKVKRQKCGQITDEGGLTKFGVASKSNGQSTVENLTLAQAQAIFKSKYYDPSGAAKLKTNGQPSCPKACLAASVYYQMPARLKNIYQRMTGLSGEAAIEKLNAMSDEEFILRFSDARLEEYKQTATWGKYSVAYTNRTTNEKGWARTLSA